MYKVIIRYMILQRNLDSIASEIYNLGIHQAMSVCAKEYNVMYLKLFWALSSLDNFDFWM